MKLDLNIEIHCRNIRLIVWQVHAIANIIDTQREATRTYKLFWWMLFHIISFKWLEHRCLHDFNVALISSVEPSLSVFLRIFGRQNRSQSNLVRWISLNVSATKTCRKMYSNEMSSRKLLSSKLEKSFSFAVPMR